MDKFEIALVAFLMACNTTAVVIRGSHGTGYPSAIELGSNTLSFHIFRTQSFVTALSAACSSPSITSIALHANLYAKQAFFSFRESSHVASTDFLYLIATTQSDNPRCHL